MDGGRSIFKSESVRADLYYTFIRFCLDPIEVPTRSREEGIPRSLNESLIPLPNDEAAQNFRHASANLIDWSET